MTPADDPKMRRRMAREDWGYTAWVASGLALLVIAGVMVFAAGTYDDARSRPAASVPGNPSPPATTGSGANTDRD